MTLEWSVLEKEIEISFSRNSFPSSFQEWLSSPSPENFGSAILLKEIVENGSGRLEAGKIRIEFLEVTKLSNQDRELLGFPPPFPYDLKIESEGVLEEPEFRFCLRFYIFEGGKELFGRVSGPFVEFGGGEWYSLSTEQFLVIERAIGGRKPSEGVRSFEEKLIQLAEIKKIGEGAGVKFDGYLQNQEVIVPEKIILDIQKTGQDSVEVVPEIEGVEKEGFEKKFRQYPTGRSVYNFEGADGKRKRVVFSPKECEEIKKIRRVLNPKGSDKERILNQPQEIFDPDIVDLDQFSKRVKEIGFYKPRFYPFVCPYKSQWVPGFIAETGSEERKRVEFPTPEALMAFEKVVNKGRQEGASTIKWEGNEIPIDDAEKIVNTGKKQFRDTSKPAKEENGGQKVLIIKENVEVLEHEERNEFPPSDQETFIHRFSPPPFLKPEYELLEHQKEGVAWLQSLCECFSGGLLADDMGLGKTLQVLSFILWHHQNRNPEKKPYLIVAPVSLLENWENEFKRFFSISDTHLIRFYAESAAAVVDQTKNSIECNLKSGIVFTTYETMRKHQISLGKVEWAACILDEAQRIKTPGTLVTNAAKALKSTFKIAMTGTPVENSLVDLWCIMDFIVPGLLGSGKEFAREYSNPLKNSDTDLKAIGEKLRKRIGIYIKRRMKADVAKELPKKSYIEIREEMPSEQQARYKLEISRANIEDGDEKERRNKILRFISNIRDISDHPYLTESQIDLFTTDQVISSSAKLKGIIKVLDEIQSRGEKVILFAGRKPTQKMLAKVVLSKFGFYPSIINGDTPASVESIKSVSLSRQQTIEQFQEKVGFNVLVMSPLAGGVGLNITGANHVIHYSRHWNPAKEEQATDRVYRIGQKREVFVYFPMAISSEFKTFDEILNERLQRKRELASASLFPTERAEVTPDELFSELSGTPKKAASLPPLAIEEVDKMDPYIFESAIGAIFKKMGFQVMVTPRVNDKGADVITFSGSTAGNFLIQAKHSRRVVGDSSVGEILKAKGFYEEKYPGSNFTLKVITNRGFTDPTLQMSRINNVDAIGREVLCSFLDAYPITMKDVLEIENNRLSQ